MCSSRAIVVRAPFLVTSGLAPARVVVTFRGQQVAPPRPPGRRPYDVPIGVTVPPLEAAGLAPQAVLRGAKPVPRPGRPPLPKTFALGRPRLVSTRLRAVALVQGTLVVVHLDRKEMVTFPSAGDAVVVEVQAMRLTPSAAPRLLPARRVVPSLADWG